MNDHESNVLSMARIELLQDPIFGDLITGPAPVVRGTRFHPLQEIRVQVECVDSQGRPWRSQNAYLVGADGVFDTSTTPAVGEQYYGVAREGALTAMVCLEGPGHDFGGVPQRLSYKISCFDGSKEIWSQGVTRSLGRDSSVLPKPWARVLLFADHIGLSQRHEATALAPYGVEVISEELLRDSAATGSAFGSSHLPTFILGSGRASARALQAAIDLDGVRGVLLFSGGGLRFDPISSLQGDDEEQSPAELEYIELDQRRLETQASGFFATRKLYAEAVADRKALDRARIKVEHIACPIYMFSGLDDQIWPSSAFSELIVQRRWKKNSPFPTVHRTFEGVGHDLGPCLGLPTLPTTERSLGHPDTDLRFLLGGKMGRQARARRECWDTMVRIFSGNPPAEPPRPKPLRDQSLLANRISTDSTDLENLPASAPGNSC